MTPRPRAVAIAGLTVVGAYLLAVALTPVVTGHHVRPLYDSIGPSQPYRWVNPPKEFASTNVEPKRQEDVTVALIAGVGTEDKGPGTLDGQAIISMVRGAIPPHGNDTSVVVRFQALDPKTLGPLPPGEKADGNAYRISATYQPSNTPIARLAKPGNVSVESALGADGIVFSADDGRTWRVVEAFAIGGATRVAAVMTDFGVYAPARSPNAPKPTVTTPSGGGSSGPAIAIGVIGASLVAVVVAALLIRRRDPRR